MAVKFLCRRGAVIHVVPCAECGRLWIYEIGMDKEPVSYTRKPNSSTNCQHFTLDLDTDRESQPTPLAAPQWFASGHNGPDWSLPSKGWRASTTDGPNN
jgi:hypothetical protein